MITAFTYGLYAALATIVITLIEYFTGMQPGTAQWFGYLSLPFLILFIYLAIKARRDEEFDGSITYGQGVGTGTLVGVSAGLISAIFMFIYLKYINPEFVDLVMDQQKAALLKQGKMPADQIEKAMDMGRQWALPIISITMIFTTIIFSLVFSLIISLFTRSKEPEPV